MQQTKFFFPLIFLFGEEAIPKRAGYTGSWPKTGAIHANTTITAVYTKDSGIVIPTQPTDPGEIMSGGEGEPVEADVPAEDETVSPQGTHVTGTQTVTHEYLTLNGKVTRETIKTNDSLTAVLDFIYDASGKPFALKYSTDGATFDTYYYVLNLQGDVVKLIQANGHVVAHYTYDAWGKILDSGGDLSPDFKLQLIGGPLLTEFNRMYENQFMASLLRILERPGAYIECPSLDRLLDIITGYTVAVYDMTGYHISFERKFRQYLCFKYNKDENECSLQQLLLDGKDDRSGFESFAREFKVYKTLFEKRKA